MFASGQYYVKNPNAGKEGPELIPVRDSQAGGSSRQAIVITRREHGCSDILQRLRESYEGTDR